jgi:site-specific DNA-methyltransferase (adenine-specific)
MIPASGYNIILADPAWRYSDKCMHRGGAERHYPTMSVKEIARLNIQSIAARDALLFLWVTNPFVVRGVHTHVAERWGFTLKTIAFVWAKTSANGDPSIGMGHWTRANPELCFLGVRGHPKRLNADVSSLIIAPRMEHSAKPPEVRDRIVRLCGDLPRIELFARERVIGWDTWGNAENVSQLC